MNGGFRDWLAWLMPWRGNRVPYPVSGPYGVAAGQSVVAGAQAAEVFVTGTAAGQTHEH
ncbi:MAG: hypothetical protein JW888_15645 [Pirellulales bacterium]|nr:hypothetical protein [Pirellulales bacterium]